MGIPGPDTDIALHKVKPLREKQAGPPPAVPAQAEMGWDSRRDEKPNCSNAKLYSFYNKMSEGLFISQKMNFKILILDRIRYASKAAAVTQAALSQAGVSFCVMPSFLLLFTAPV